VLIRKYSNNSRKNHESNQSRGNKTHIIFIDPKNSNGKVPNSVTNHTNFNLSGPVNVRQDSIHNPFDPTVLQHSQKASIVRDSNKSQQLIPDTNSTLAYTAA
jgi:hypothetical protein